MPRHSQSSKHRRPAAWPWLATWVLGMGGLVVLTAWRQVPLIEHYLLDDVQEAVRPIVSAPVTISIDGRDATIAGPAADGEEREALLAAVADVVGVRTVTDRLTMPEAAIATPAPSGPPPVAPALPVEDGAPVDASATIDLPRVSDAAAVEASGPPVDPGGASDLRQPSLSLAVVDRALTLRGRIGADQDLSELVQPALAAFDPSYLTNRIDTTEPTAAADWIEPVAALLPRLAELPDAALDISDRQVTLTGTAPSRSSHDRLIDQVGATFADYAVVERVEIDPSVPTVEPSIATGTGTASSLTDVNARDVDTGVDALDGDSTAGIGAADADKTALPPAIRQASTTASPLRRALDALDGDRLVFESGSDLLTASSARRLEQLVDLFQTHPGVIVEIEGHTDSTGPAELNLSLSQQRASAVKRALVERGLDAERLVAYGYGEGVPVADNSTAEGRARNRRIEFRF